MAACRRSNSLARSRCRARTGRILPFGIFSNFEPTPVCIRHFCDGGHIGRNRGSARCHHPMTPSLPAQAREVGHDRSCDICLPRVGPRIARTCRAGDERRDRDPVSDACGAGRAGRSVPNFVRSMTCGGKPNHDQSCDRYRTDGPRADAGRTPSRLAQAAPAHQRRGARKIARPAARPRRHRCRPPPDRRDRYPADGSHAAPLAHSRKSETRFSARSAVHENGESTMAGYRIANDQSAGTPRPVAKIAVVSPENHVRA